MKVKIDFLPEFMRLVNVNLRQVKNIKRVG